MHTPAWVVSGHGDDANPQLVERPLDAITAPIVVAVAASAVNYKDALAVTGRGRILRTTPLVVGIDLAGTVVRSNHVDWPAGTPVVVCGRGLGEERDGGLATYCGVEPEDLLPLPDGWTPAAAMALGTAGQTAAHGVALLQRHGVTPAHGPLVVTGATGGVAGIALRLLYDAGYQVHAVTTKHADLAVRERLHALGVADIIPGDEWCSGAGSPLQRAAYAGGIDTTGGEPLAALLRRTLPYGAVATAGVAAGSNLPTSMFPFVLRGIGLLGIASVHLPDADRQAAWQCLTAAFTPAEADVLARRVALVDVLDAATGLVDGTNVGRVVVDVS